MRENDGESIDAVFRGLLKIKRKRNRKETRHPRPHDKQCNENKKKERKQKTLTHACPLQGKKNMKRENDPYVPYVYVANRKTISRELVELPLCRVHFVPPFIVQTELDNQVGNMKGERVDKLVLDSRTN